MQVLHPRCAGIDIHKKSIVVCALLSLSGGQVEKHERTFGTTTGEILRFLIWLRELGVDQVVMESTGVYWWPIYQLLEGQVQITVANPGHVKNLPGRKTDQSDAEWLAELHRHGLIQGSFVPPAPQRELRELTRHRLNLTAKRAQCTNQMERTLEGTNLKLASVVSDLRGVSATRILEALLAGQTDPKALAALAVGKLRKKKAQLEEALQGVMKDHHKLVLRQLLEEIELFDEQITELDAQIEQRLQSQEELIERLDEITGVDRKTAQVILAELGSDTQRFGQAERAASWAGVCPGNNQSGGKRRTGRSRKGNKFLKSTLVQAGQAAGRSKDTYLGAQFRRIAARRGKKRAALAVGHSILKISFHMIARGTHYQELGSNYFDRQKPEVVKNRLVRRLEKLGYVVTVTSANTPVIEHSTGPTPATVALAT